MTPPMDEPQTRMTLEPCPFCGERLAIRKGTAFHPDSKCLMHGAQISNWEFSAWNRRASSAETHGDAFAEFDKGKEASP